MIKQQSGTPWREMYKVFNMGHRMELYVPEKIAGRLSAIAESFGIDAKIIGRCEKAPGAKLTIRSEYGEFVYEE
jgi:phosphoribosylformylglycinamidine cyclo-ligase